MTEPIRLRTNEYWGRRSGSISKTGERIFKGKRASIQRRENRGPTGRALRRRGDINIGRPRKYANPKLARRAQRMTFEEERYLRKVAARKSKRPQGTRTGARA